MDSRIGAAISVFTFVAFTACSSGSQSNLPRSNVPLAPAMAAPGPGRSTSPLLRKATVTEIVLHSFGASGDGVQPVAKLLNVNGVLYGTTYAGGDPRCRIFGCGTIFKITTAGAETVLHSFDGQPHGQYPEAGLTNVNGLLYGTTNQGGVSDIGTVFKIKPSGASYAVLHNFARLTSDGAYPNGLIYVGGTLYGTTFRGGTHGSGTVFKVTTAGVETVLHSFGSKSDGQCPYAGLTNVNGALYGTTGGGGGTECGRFGCGTIFKITTAGVKTLLHSFAESDGSTPRAALTNVGGTLYGTTYGGGTHGAGTVFKITTAGTSYSVLHNFGGGTDGAYPYAGLIDVNGTLYGTTSVGGAGCSPECGTVFKIKPSGASYAVLYNFAGGNDGKNPSAGLATVGGMLYGTTAEGGGAYNSGTVFSLSGF
jgi:uncharacterized repeat protein (TIGR03803 family)